jgi:hypothetical protein
MISYFDADFLDSCDENGSACNSSDDSVHILDTAHPVEVSLLKLMQKYSIPAAAYADLMDWYEKAAPMEYPYKTPSVSEPP